MATVVKDNYVKAREGIRYVCLQAAPCLESVLETWHMHQKVDVDLQPCTTPDTCPTNGKPTKARGSCANCISWGAVIESACYPSTSLRGLGIAWANVNPTLLYHNTFEMAKAFVHLPGGANPKSVSDLGPDHLLSLMKNLGEFHKFTTVHYDIISKVSGICSTLFYNNNFDISVLRMNQFFGDMVHLLSCLKDLQYITQTQADDIRCELNKLQINPVTSEMEERALQPFHKPAEMEQTLYDVMEEQLPIFFPTVISAVTDGNEEVSSTALVQTEKEQDGKQVGQFAVPQLEILSKDASDMRAESLQTKPNDVDHSLKKESQTDTQFLQTQITSKQDVTEVIPQGVKVKQKGVKQSQFERQLEGQQDVRHTTEEVEDLHQQEYKSIFLPVGMITEFDFKDVIQLLGPDDLQKLYQALGIRHQDIEKAEKSANTDDVELRARAIFQLWWKESGKAATRPTILQALEKCNNIEAKETLEAVWNMKDVDMASESKLYAAIQSLGPDDLQKLYQTLGIRQQDIEKAEKSAKTEDMELKAKAVLRWWKKIKGKKASLDAILQALEECKLKAASLATRSTSYTEGTDKATNVEFDLKNFKSELIDLYEVETGHILLLPWNTDCHDTRYMDDIYVELELEKVDSKRTDKSQFRRKKDADSRKTDRYILEKNQDIVALKTLKDKLATRVIVKGLAGSGKSTLLSKLAYDWSKQNPDSPLNKFELLFLLRMNLLQKGCTLVEAVYQQIVEDLPQGLKEYIRDNSGKVLILLDGWDESDLDLDTVVLHDLKGKKEMKMEQILAYQMLRKSCVVVSTRPHRQLGPVQSQYYLSINLKGFSAENIVKYIIKFFHDSENARELITGLIDKLHNSYMLRSISTIPVLLMLLCTLWEDQESFPITQSLLYKEFVNTIWKRFCLKQKSRIEKEPTNIECSYFLHFLGKIALEGLLSHDVQDEIIEFPEEIFGSLCEVGLKVGLITRQRWQFKQNEKSSISFLHKSVQEFCAGRYLAILSGKEHSIFYNILTKVDSWKLILQKMELLKFCCGMSQEHSGVKGAIAVIAHAISKHALVSGGSQEDSAGSCKAQEEVNVGGKDSGKTEIQPLLILLYESQLRDSNTLVSFFKALISVETLCVFNSHPQTLPTFHFFVQSKFGKALDEIKTISFEDHTYDSLDVISDTLTNMPDVENVKIVFKKTDVSIPSKKSMIKVSEEIGVLSKLSKFYLRSVPENPFDMSIILHHLATSCNSTKVMKNFQLSNVHVGNSVEHLCSIITPFLEELTLPNSSLQEEHIQKLCSYLSNAPNLLSLELSNNVIGATLTELAYQLRNCPKLTELYLSDIHLSDSGVIALAESFPYLLNLETLWLEGSDEVGNEGLSAVFLYLQHLKKLELFTIAGAINADCSPLVKACVGALGIEIPLENTVIEIEISDSEQVSLVVTAASKHFST